MNRWRYLVLLFVVIFFGCANQGKEKPSTIEERSALPSPVTAVPIYNDAQPSGIDNRSDMERTTIFPGTIPFSERIIYFDFDKSDIRPDTREIITAHGAYLSANSNVHIRLEGHADERGSREYNLALSERRAESVKRNLMALGVLNSQLTILSYGEEKPVALEHNEAAWQLNRRVELVYHP